MDREPRDERIEDEPPYRDVPPRDPDPDRFNDPDIPRGDGDPWDRPHHHPDEPERDFDGIRKQDEDKE